MHKLAYSKRKIYLTVNCVYCTDTNPHININIFLLLLLTFPKTCFKFHHSSSTVDCNFQTNCKIPGIGYINANQILARADQGTSRPRHRWHRLIKHIHTSIIWTSAVNNSESTLIKRMFTSIIQISILDYKLIAFFATNVVKLLSTILLAQYDVMHFGPRTPFH